MLGRNCARALATLALAAARLASASRMSGRCASSSEGRPGVTRGMAMLEQMPPRMRTRSGGRASSTASALRVLASASARAAESPRVGCRAGLSCCATCRARTRCRPASRSLDQIEHAGGAGDVLARRPAVGPAPPAPGSRHSRQSTTVVRPHHLAVVAAGDRGFLGRAQRRTILAPEVDLVAGGQRRR